MGLEAQQSAVESYAKQNSGRIIAEYREVESGKNSDRAELAKALAHAKRSKAKLVVAKLDRLSRNVAFLSALMESRVDFVAVDNPHANKLTIHVLSVMAEHEAEMISQRTKAALAAAKARGVKLGSARDGAWEGREHLRQAACRKASKVAAEVHRTAADAAYDDLYGLLAELRQSGNSLNEIAGKLNELGHTTRRGKQWNPMQVKRVLDRA